MQSIPALLEAEPALTTITATRRLSRRLLHEYNSRQLSEGRLSWPTPDIVSWSAWIQRLWRSHVLLSGESRTLLSSAQTLGLWQNIIEKSSDALINTQATARHAQSARQLVLESAIDLSADEVRQWFVYDSDASRWLDWHQQYCRRLDENGWVDAAAVVVEIIDQVIHEKRLIDTPAVIFAGFDHYTSQQENLRSWLQQTGRLRDAGDAYPATPSVYRVPLSDPQEEFTQAACWAREQYEQAQEAGEAGETPIGIIVPQLEQCRDDIELAMRRAFYPCDVLSPVDARFHTQGIRQESIFNISMGHTLSHQPAMRTALNILALCRFRFSYEVFSQVLRSPYVGNWQDRASIRSFLDDRLRTRLGVETNLGQLLKQIDGADYPDEHACLHRLDKLRAQWGGCCLPSQWVERFQSCLALFNWPAAGLYDRHLQQILQSLEDVWLELARQDRVRSELSFDEALALFNTLVSAQVFQSGAAELPVQVLGMIEAAGMTFSRLWVMQMTEQNWPQAANPNPFIPLKLQREFNIPHSSAMREYDYASRQTRRILRSSEQVIFSYAESMNEEAVSPSPLIAHYPVRDMFGHETVAGEESLGEESLGEESLGEEPLFEYVLDDKGPAINTRHYHAGSNAIKDQSQCPFRAFIRHRLHAQSPEEQQPGNDPRDRGNSVHRVMEQLWQQWRTSDTLRTLGEKELAADVRAAISQVMKAVDGLHNPDIEARRLFNLIMEWLEQEKQRSPFTVIHQEQRLKADVDGLALHLIVDRIDQLEDGSHCVVDYKTGSAKTSQWVGERPEEPQLPLYTVVQPHDVAAVTFANIRSGESAYQGVANDKSLLAETDPALAGIRQIPVTKGNAALKQYTDWQGMLQAWDAGIRALARAHRQGEAQVDPHRYPETCRYCDVDPVCRLFDWQEADDEGA